MVTLRWKEKRHHDCFKRPEKSVPRCVPIGRFGGRTPRIPLMKVKKRDLPVIEVTWRRMRRKAKPRARTIQVMKTPKNGRMCAAVFSSSALNMGNETCCAIIAIANATTFKSIEL